MISVIIPALNEEEHIICCIDRIRMESPDSEIIVADGGSTDRTREAALSCAQVSVIGSPRGRGTQMNSGAAAAVGKVLLFLHADTMLETGWSSAVRDALQTPDMAGGAFSFAVNSPAWRFRSVEAWVKMRCRVFNMPYGDQAIFIRKEVFDRVGGYKPVPLMEDVDLVARMKRQGRVVILEKKAFTSARRWEKKGLVRTAAINQITRLLYQLGVPPDRLARFYYR